MPKFKKDSTASFWLYLRQSLLLTKIKTLLRMRLKAFINENHGIFNDRFEVD